MNWIIAMVLVVMYIIVFLIGRMVGIYEGKEVVMKVLKEWKEDANNKE
jgi:hypothetical protein